MRLFLPSRMPQIDDGCQVVPEGALFLASRMALSLDSSYYGAVSVPAIPAVAFPIMTWRCPVTRAERLATAERLAREQLERQRTRLVKVQAQQRAEERKALTRRRYLLGQLVDEAGLFALSDTVLTGLFAALSRLVDVPDPVATLEGLLCNAVGSPGRPVDGMAQAAPGVAPTVPVG